jgi:hypothetical protein
MRDICEISAREKNAALNQDDVEGVGIRPEILRAPVACPTKSRL